MSGFIMGAFVVIAIVVLSVGGATILDQVSKKGRECNLNSDCGSERFCGSDFKCHDYPSIQKTVNNYNFMPAATIIALAIVLAALILRFKRDQPKSYY
jgi:hypothetical protein